MTAVKKIGHWFKNYWYYYKWPVIIAAFFVFVLAFCLLSQVKKEKYDINILYTGPYTYADGEKAGLCSTLAQIMPKDFDQNGQKTVSILNMTAYSDEQWKELVEGVDDLALLVQYAQYTVDQVSDGFAQQLLAGDTVICLLDPFWYQRASKEDAFAPLSEVLGYTPENLNDEYSIRYEDLEISEYDGLDLPEDTLLCFRRPSTASALIGKKETVQNYQNSKEMLASILAFKVN